MKESLTIIYTLILKYLKGAHTYIARNRKYNISLYFRATQRRI